MTSQPEWLFEAFRVTKQENRETLTAVCEVWSCVVGWRLRLVVDGHGLNRSTVEYASSAVSATRDLWLADLLKEGWRQISGTEVRTEEQLKRFTPISELQPDRSGWRDAPARNPRSG
jgi:hypothetical protein